MQTPVFEKPVRNTKQTPTPNFFILFGRFSKVFQKFKRIPIMLHFQYFFTIIKTQNIRGHSHIDFSHASRQNDVYL